MDHPQHPDDERLAALAGADPEASGDAALREHVSGCDRCASVVDELTTLRAALASLPDVAPSRPLRLIPPVEEAPTSFADRLAVFVRRGFAPALVAGAGLALIGAVGTASPSGILPQAASAPTDAPELMFEESGATAAPGAGEPEPAAEPALTPAQASEGTTLDAAAADERVVESDAAGAAVEAPTQETSTEAAAATEAAAERSRADEALRTDAERSPWPMVLFAGVALIVAAVLLRWILQPRAG